jgi:transposase
MATRIEWASRVRRWRRSGLTAREFAEREGYNARTLSWWASALRDETSGPAKFIDVTAAVASALPPLDFVVRETVVIRVRPGFDAALLRDVVAALEAR